MTNAATVAQDMTEAPIPTDPNAIVAVMVRDRLNAGKEPSTRWGRLKFDNEGVAEVKLPLKDVVKLHELKWLSVEDQEKYLGLSQEAAAVVTATTSEMAEMQAQLDATKNANTRLASKNAELEAKIDELLTKYQNEYKAYQKQIDEQMTALTEELSGTKKQLDGVMTSTQKVETENVELKKQLADAEKKIKKLDK